MILGNVGALILNAGRSRRMGRPKSALVYDAKTTFFERALHLARVGNKDRFVVVVVGPDSHAIRLPDQDIVTSVNPMPDRGMFSSVKIGVATVLAAVPELAGLLLFLVDHPLVHEATVAALLETHRANSEVSCVPTYEGQTGHPVLLPRKVLDTIEEAGWSDRLDTLITTSELVPVNDPGILLNINTPEAFAKHFGPR